MEREGRGVVPGSVRRTVGAIALGAVVLAGCGSGDNDATTGSDGGARQTTTSRADSTGSSAPTVPGTGTKLEVVESGFTPGVSTGSGAAVVHAAAVLENPGEEATQSMQVTFTFKDAAGNQVAVERFPLYRVEPGGVAHAQVASVATSGTPATVEVDAAPVGASAFPPVVLGVEVERVGTWPQGALLDLSVSNPSADPIDQGLLACVIRRDGKVVGGAAGIVRDPIEPGSSAKIQANGYVRGDSAECSGTGVGPT